MDNNDNIKCNNEQPPQQPYPHPFVPNKEQIRSFKRAIPVSIYDFYIVDEIGAADKYLELIQTLKSADHQDTVFIYLNTIGGNLYTTIQILAGIATTHAKVITCMEGQVCSAGTFIFLKGDTKIVNANSTFMIHNYSQVTSGKGNEIVTQVGYQKDYFEKLARDVYGKFLTEEEIQSVISGNDLWMHSHEVVERLEKNDHDFIYTGDDLEVDVEVKAELMTTSQTKPNKRKPTTKKKIVKRKPTKKK